MFQQDLVDFLSSIALVIIGWFGMLFRSTSKRLKDLEENKVDNHDLVEIKDDIKKILGEITELKVEQATWRGRQEQAWNNKRENT